MNIHFKTHFPWPGADGQPERTHFAQRIMNAFAPDHFSAPRPGDVQGTKLHTIRRLPANGQPRYRECMKLVMCTGSRFKPNPFLETECTGTQLLRLAPRQGSTFIDLMTYLVVPGKVPHLIMGEELTRLAENDGLSVYNFLKWFTLDVISNGPGDYQLVHWSDVRY